MSETLFSKQDKIIKNCAHVNDLPSSVSQEMMHKNCLFKKYMNQMAKQYRNKMNLRYKK